MSNPTESTSPARMSGGELAGPAREIFAELSKRIAAEPDVHRVIDLTPLNPEKPEDLWHYLIETPFATFPKFVIGLTDIRNDSPSIVFQSGTEWAAMEEWQLTT